MSDVSSSGTDPVVRGYAQGVVAVATGEGALARVSDELFSFARAVDAAPQLRERLSDPGIDVAAKQAAVGDLLGSRAHPATLAAVTLVIQGGRSRQLGDIADAVAELAAAADDRSLAEVRSAVALDDAQRQRLAAALGQAVGRPVELKVVIDPTVVGGLVARIGDTVIDGSVARRLATVRSRLVGA